MTKENEIWLPIPGFPGYDASNLGRIRSYLRHGPKNNNICEVPQRILKQSQSTNYPQVGVTQNDKRKSVYVHHLIALAFLGPRPDGTEICHRNGNGFDNRIINLRYDTHANNELDKIIQGTSSTTNLTKRDIVDIRKTAAAGKTVQELAKQYGLKHWAISSICYGRTFKQFGGPILSTKAAIQTNNRVTSQRIRGEGNPKARLSIAQVKSIRALVSAGIDSREELAAMFGVTPPTISKIILQQTWQHI